MRVARLIPLFLAIVFSCRAGAEESAALAAPYDPTEHWEVDYETGLLWKFSGDATPLSYTFLPQILTFKSPRVGTARPFFGGDLVMRNRFSLLGEPIIAGPEHHFIGGSASGIMEWWDKPRTRALFFASGEASAGWTARATRSGGQGEDFNLNWLAYAGRPPHAQEPDERIAGHILPARLEPRHESREPRGERRRAHAEPWLEFLAGAAPSLGAAAGAGPAPLPALGRP